MRNVVSIFSMILVAVATAGISVSPALAQGTGATSTIEGKVDTAASSVDLYRTGLPQGWTWNAGLTLGGNALSNEYVIGQPDGRTVTLVGKFDFETLRVHGTSEWLTTAKIHETYSRTPVVDRMVKSNDVVGVDSIYKYFFPSIPMLGAYAKFSLETSLLPYYDERADDVQYTIDNNNKPTETKNGERLKLADSLSPMTLKESVGLVVRPYAKQWAQVEMRFGAAAQQFIRKDQYALVDTDAAKLAAENGNVAVYQYEDDVRITGLEFFLQVMGSSPDSKITYKASTEALMPVAYHPGLEDDDDISKAKLTATDSRIGVTFNMLEWLGLGYDFRAYRSHLIQPEAQTTHNFLATIAFKTAGRFD